mgnify:CR=1 FL=1
MAVANIFPNSQDRGEGFGGKASTIFCKCYLADNFPPDATESNILLTTLIDDTNMHSNSVNPERITIGEDGFYLIIAHGRMYNAGANEYLNLKLYDNTGQQLELLGLIRSTSTQTNTLCTVLYLKEHQYIYLAVYNNTGSSSSGLSGGTPTNSTISVYKLAV